MEGAKKRSLQSRHRNGETRRNLLKRSEKLRGRDGRRYRLPHFGQAIDIAQALTGATGMDADRRRAASLLTYD
jgi:hypothetical protein